ncbi:MAG: RidA family protein [Rhodospirillales bacterium]|jgi:enamine deaminase RidA (YjgF/YER057c/UK114 family)
MTKTIEQRLKDIGLEIPKAPAPAANYVPYTIANGLVHISGQVPFADGELKYIGTVGDDLTLEDGYQAARLCGINIISQILSACDGDLERVKRIVKLGGFVNAAADFKDHPKVINGASDLMAEVFGDKGKHARFAVGAVSLPLGVAVEVDGIVDIA